eukprot:2076073-Pleurochrysis_carterae.AAC.1
MLCARQSTASVKSGEQEKGREKAAENESGAPPRRPWQMRNIHEQRARAEHQNAPNKDSAQ